MTINGLLFLFVFLPLALLVYHLAAEWAKAPILFLVSIIFYACCSLEFVWMLLLATMINVALSEMITVVSNKKVTLTLLCIGIAFNVWFLCSRKYTDFAISTFSKLFGTEVVLKNLALPLGISFFTFKAISLLVDSYRNDEMNVKLANRVINKMLYLTIFTQIQSGPLTRYSAMSIETDRKSRVALFTDGVYRFMIGFNKKVLIANVLANITNEVFLTPFEKFSVPYAWLGSIAFSLQLFFDFAGYSDMAIGLSEMFGYRCVENFNYPYMTESVSKFWRRWHISLSEWFRDYIYYPLGGSRNKNRYRVYFNLFVVWALTGLWHGAAWNYIAWGLGYFVVIAFEKATGWPEKFTHRISKVFYRVFTLLFINFEWVLFNSAGLKNGLLYIKHMFICETNPLSTTRALFLIKDYSAFFVIAILLCTPIVPVLDEKTSNNKTLHVVYELLLTIIIAVGFLWSLSLIVSGQNNPFTYANF